MNKLSGLIKKAQTSKFYLWVLNIMMHRVIPFNKVHGLKITTITEHGFEITMPYWKENMNHLKGLHACGLATLSEYVAGLTLIRKTGAENYRLIMENINVQYFYQAKDKVVTAFELTDEWMEKNVKEPLKTQDATFVVLEAHIFDTKGNKICTGTTRWQIKRWDKVKTKI